MEIARSVDYQQKSTIANHFRHIYYLDILTVILYSANTVLIWLIRPM